MPYPFDAPLSETPQSFIVVVNDGSEVIPPCAVMEVADVNSDGHLVVQKPTRDNANRNLLFNSTTPIRPLAYGQGCQTLPGLVAYNNSNETGAAPAQGEVWGVEAGSWFLSKYRTGFVIVGGPGSNSNVVVVDLMGHNLVHAVRKTSDTKTQGRYPGKLLLVDPLTGGTTDVEDIWIFDLNE